MSFNIQNFQWYELKNRIYFLNLLHDFNDLFTETLEINWILKICKKNLDYYIVYYLARNNFRKSDFPVKFIMGFRHIFFNKLVNFICVLKRIYNYILIKLKLISLDSSVTTVRRICLFWKRCMEICKFMCGCQAVKDFNGSRRYNIITKKIFLT